MIDPDDARPAASTALLEAATPNGQPEIATIEELRRSRTLVATMPSGAVVRVRPPNMDLVALTGALPNKLRHLTTPSSTELNRRLSQQAQNEQQEEEAKLLAEYLVEIVRNTIVEPDLSRLATFEQLDEVMLPVDFHWLLQIGQRETDYDGAGKRMWGMEPISRWAPFREEHGCPPDCDACAQVLRRLSVAAV